MVTTWEFMDPPEFHEFPYLNVDFYYSIRLYEKPKAMRILLSLCLLALSSLLTGQRVTVQNPVDFLTQFQDIYVDDAGTGYAVGTCGAIVFTENDGTTWARIDGPVAGDNYGAVGCSPAGCASGVVLGGRGYLATRQGDGNWSITEEFGTPFGVENIYWLTDQIVIADLGQDEYYRSTDAGQSWTTVTLPVVIRDNLSFPSSTAGFFLGDDRKVYNSKDQGASWQETGYTHDTIFRRIFTLNDDVLFFMDAENNISRSLDGGQTFTTVTPDVNVRTADYFIAFSPDTIAVATGFNTTYLSSDAGATWVQTPSGDLNTGVRGQFHQRGQEVFILGAISTIYYSSRGFGDFVSQIPGDRENRLQEVAFVNDQVGYAGGIRGTLLKTTDGGASWSKLTLPGTGASAVTDIEIISEDEVVILFNGISPQVTTDGGQTFSDWLPTSVPTENRSVSQYALLPGGRQYLLGPQSAVYSDDGTNFTAITLDLASNVDALHFADDDNGWAVGSRNVYRTRDGGASWQQLTSPTTQPVEGVYFFDANTGIVSTGSSLYRTTDGGDTWGRFASPGGYDFSLNADDGALYVASFASGNNGSVSRSYDQGETWEEIAYICAPFRGGGLTPSGKFFYGVGDGTAIVKVDIDIVNPIREAVQPTTPLRVYPNPASSFFNVEIPPSREASTVSIFSASGRLVQEEPIAEGQPLHRVALDNLPKGLYLVRWSSPNGPVRTARVVRQ
jgi:photosystem II stability/assembly factor-like uncharacterized protein